MKETIMFNFKNVRIFTILFTVLTTLSSCNAISPIFIRTNNDISIKIYQALVKNEATNFVFGIFPLDAMIALTYLGTAGEISSEIKSVFAWNASDDQMKLEFPEAIRELRHLPHCKLQLCNRIYAADRLNFDPKFSDIALRFDTNLVKVDFGSPKQAAEKVNQWTSHCTVKYIENWVSEKLFSAQTDLVSVNNLILHSKWQQSFDKKETKKMDFYISSNETVQVDMMKISGDFMVFRHPVLKCKMMKIPYKNEKMYMVIMLADDIDDVDYIERNAHQFWNDRNFTSKYITLYLPRFKITSTIDMIPILKHVGVTKLFSSEIHGITKEPAKLSVVTQKIYVEVDERGTIAEDSDIIEKRGPKKHTNRQEQGEVFNVNRPFVFGILYDDLSLIFGRIKKL